MLKISLMHIVNCRVFEETFMTEYSARILYVAVEREPIGQFPGLYYNDLNSIYFPQLYRTVHVKIYFIVDL